MTLEHGESFITIDHNIIILKAKGSFNKYGISKLYKKLSLILNDFHEDGFKLLFDLIDVEGGTPEAYEVVNTFNIWLNDKNLVAKALVTNSPLIKPFLSRGLLPESLKTLDILKT